MTKPMTVEELKEKARLTDEERVDIVISEEEMGVFIPLKTHNAIMGVIKAQQDKDFKAFIQFCKENQIYQVAEGELPVTDELISWSDVRNAGYVKVKPVSEVLK